MVLNATVKTISYSQDGVLVSLTDGQVIQGDFALCTFSLGVLQNDDVQFDPPLPGALLFFSFLSIFVDLSLSLAYKIEAIHSMTMTTYTKIFLQFPEKFWFDTEV